MVMNATTKEFLTATVVSLSTGCLVGDRFAKMQECAEWIMGHPIWTHEFAEKSLCTRLRDAVIAQHPQLAQESADGIDSSNVDEYRTEIEKRYGKTLPIKEGRGERTEDPVSSAIRIMGRTE